jgi:transposase
MLVEAAWVAVKTPGPLRAFYERIRSRRGMQIAVVATARKLAVLCWHLVIKCEDCAFARGSLTEKKLRKLQLRAGMPSQRGRKGKSAAYNLKEVRRRERELAEQAERSYRQLVAPSLSTSGETLTIEESMTLRARTENAGDGDEDEWSWGCG